MNRDASQTVLIDFMCTLCEGDSWSKLSAIQKEVLKIRLKKVKLSGTYRQKYGTLMNVALAYYNEVEEAKFRSAVEEAKSRCHSNFNGVSTCR